MFSFDKSGKTLMKHRYIIVDDNHQSILNTQAVAMRFQNLAFAGYANNYDDAINLVLEQQPSLVFLEINPDSSESNLSLNIINELHRYLSVVPKIIVTTKDQSLVFRAMEYGVADYLVKPLELNAFRKAIFKFDKSIVQSLASITTAQEVQIPQKTLTFSDFLRQEPVSKATVDEKIATPNDDTADFTTNETISSIPKEVEQTPSSEEIHTTAVDKIDESAIVEESAAESEPSSVPEEQSEVTSSEHDEEVIDEEVQEEENVVSAIESTKQADEEEDVHLEQSKLEPTEDNSVTIFPAQRIIVEQEQPLIICVKSYGDYRYIDSRDILYFKADNNSVDIHMKDGEMVTAFKTLKVFETLLPKNHFLRIHNTYIINISQVSRIHTGNNQCYIKNTNVKLPFSKSYKENIELIITKIATGNYLEF